MTHPFDPMSWSATATPLAALLIGALLLFFGRRLFWLFVGIVGFMAGWYLALGSWHHAPAGGRLLLALFAGLIGVLLAIFLQKIAVAVAGFIFGAYLVANLLGWQMQALHPGQLLILLVAGLVAAFLALALFDLALILYTAIAGATLIVEHVHLHLAGNARLLVLVVLAAIGAAVQAHLLRGYRGRRA